jgi:rhodanese-related sulfurtransferase
MNRNYFILTLLMFILAAGTLFFKGKPEKQPIQPKELLWDIIQPTRYMSTDQVAKLIIQKNPTLELIDVRSAREYAAFSLPNAINIPLDSLASSSSLQYFGIPGTKVVLFANDDILSDQAWVLLRRQGFKGTYVMKGGLNLWMNTIIRPQAPAETAPATAIEQYHFREGARLYFTGAKVEATSSNKPKVVVRKRKRAAAVSGGC